MDLEVNRLVEMGRAVVRPGIRYINEHLATDRPCRDSFAFFGAVRVLHLKNLSVLLLDRDYKLAEQLELVKFLSPADRLALLVEYPRFCQLAKDSFAADAEWNKKRLRAEMFAWYCQLNNNHISDPSDDDIDELLSDVVYSDTALRRGLQAKRLVETGFLSRAAKKLTGLDMAILSTETIELLKEKHPQ